MHRTAGKARKGHEADPGNEINAKQAARNAKSRAAAADKAEALANIAKDKAAAGQVGRGLGMEGGVGLGATITDPSGAPPWLAVVGGVV